MRRPTEASTDLSPSARRGGREWPTEQHALAMMPLNVLLQTALQRQFPPCPVYPPVDSTEIISSSGAPSTISPATVARIETALRAAMAGSGPQSASRGPEPASGCRCVHSLVLLRAPSGLTPGIRPRVCTPGRCLSDHRPRGQIDRSDRHEHLLGVRDCRGFLRPDCGGEVVLCWHCRRPRAVAAGAPQQAASA